MMIIRKLLLVFAIMCTLNAYSQTVVGELSSTPAHSKQEYMRTKKRNVSMLRMSWGMAKACLAVCAGFLATNYMFVVVDFSILDDVEVMSNCFGNNTYSGAMVSALFSPCLYEGTSGYNRHCSLLNMSPTVQNSVVVGCGVASIALTYFVYRLMKSACNTVRDEMMMSAGIVEEFDCVGCEIKNS